MKLAEIAKRINAHLVRFENDPEINKLKGESGMKLSPFYLARATAGGAYVSIVYVSFQGSNSLRKAEALSYLEWLDAGNVGKHWEAEKSQASLR